MTNKENLEIKVHDGPARLGKLDDLKTPSIIEANSMKLCPDEPMAYNVPLSLAEWSVEQTLEKASKYRDSEECSIGTFAVIHGSKYTDLRVECAKRLDEMGYNRLLISNADELIRRPRDLADIISSLRESISPNTALCFPFAEASFLPILSYVGLNPFQTLSGLFQGFLTEINGTTIMSR